MARRISSANTSLGPHRAATGRSGPPRGRPVHKAKPHRRGNWRSRLTPRGVSWLVRSCSRPHRPFDFDGPPVWRLGGRWLFRDRLAAAWSPDAGSRLATGRLGPGMACRPGCTVKSTLRNWLTSTLTACPIGFPKPCTPRWHSTRRCAELHQLCVPPDGSDSADQCAAILRSARDRLRDRACSIPASRPS